MPNWWDITPDSRPGAGGPSFVRVRRRLRPRAEALLKSLIRGPQARRMARLILTTDLSFAAIGQRCGVTFQRVQQVWRLLSQP